MGRGNLEVEQQTRGKTGQWWIMQCECENPVQREAGRVLYISVKLFSTTSSLILGGAIPPTGLKTRMKPHADLEPLKWLSADPMQ